MNYIEYKEIFENIVSLTVKADELYKDGEYISADELLDKRDKLMAELEAPEDIDDDKLNYIYSLRDKIQEKNVSIVKSMQGRVQKITDELSKALPEENNNSTEHDFMPMPKIDIGLSIFNPKN